MVHLKGAKFQVIRATNQDIIGEFESDLNGEFTVKNILHDKYIIKEISAQKVMTWQQVLLWKLENLKHQSSSRRRL